MNEIESRLAWLDDQASRQLCLQQIGEYLESLESLVGNAVTRIAAVEAGIDVSKSDSPVIPSVGRNAKRLIECFPKMREHQEAFSYWWGTPDWLVTHNTPEDERELHLWTMRRDTAQALQDALEAVERAVTNAGIDLPADEVAAVGDDNNTRLDEIASMLEGRSFDLFEALRKHKHFVSLGTLNDDVYEGSVKDSSVKRALEKLNTDLADTEWTVKFDKSRAKLVDVTTDV
ncbi:hypothetical protein [Novipirellula artificiosorum]|uniref:Uncharacterized protein n=1 Tax=Novipirellula artificiosorum TaxID=2528016 RepID=A0A5C6DFX0_9BACT|nr:hypothetical protein [Novipirellula artificiosorum]TWU33889.1 hypothetical protein Poly41_48890 [Novipirellula artificiosorum]